LTRWNALDTLLVNSTNRRCILESCCNRRETHWAKSCRTPAAGDNIKRNTFTSRFESIPSMFFKSNDD
jgi:hypothetical protein